MRCTGQYHRTIWATGQDRKYLYTSPLFSSSASRDGSDRTVENRGLDNANDPNYQYKVARTVSTGNVSTRIPIPAEIATRFPFPAFAHEVVQYGYCTVTGTSCIPARTARYCATWVKRIQPWTLAAVLVLALVLVLLGLLRFFAYPGGLDLPLSVSPSLLSGQ